MSKSSDSTTHCLSLLDFSYYDLLMAIRCYFPSYYRRRRPFHRNRYGMLRTDRRNSDKKPWRTCCCCYAGLCASWSSDRNTERCSYRRNESAAVSCNSLYLYDYPRCRISLYRYTVAGSYTEGGWFHSIFKLTIGTGRSADRYPIGFLWMVILVLLMEFVLNHTKFGRYTIAIGSNKEAAALSGINVKFYHVMVYVVCGLFTGLAAIAYAAVTPTVQPGTGAGLEMDAIGGVFVGGVAASGGYGSVVGTLVGIFVIMLLKTGLPYVGLQANWQQIITGVVLIVAVLIDILKEKKVHTNN